MLKVPADFMSAGFLFAYSIKKALLNINIILIFLLYIGGKVM